MKRNTWLASLLLFCFFVMVGCGSTSAADNSKVIGTVNGDKITQAEFDTDYKIRNAIYDTQMAQATNNQANNGVKTAKTPDIVAKLKEKVWEDVVFQKLVFQQAAKAGIEADKDQMEKIIASDDFKSSVEKYKLDKDIYSEMVRAQLLYNQLTKKVTAKITVSDKEINDYYKDHPDNYSDPGGVKIYHILVKSEKLANDILTQLNKGADFAALAKKYSADGSKDQGGYVGVANQNSGWVKEFQDAALKVQPGQLLDKPVKSQFGYHIIKGGDRQAPSNKTFNEVKNQIKMTVQQQKQDDATQKYWGAIKQKADIKDLRVKNSTKTTTPKKTTDK